MYRAGTLLLLGALTATAPLAADTRAQQAWDDAKVIHRIAEVGKRDTPKDLITKIVQEDIDILRGKRTDGTYEFAHFEREEAGRKTEEFTVGDNGSNQNVRSDFAYRLTIDSPSRRYLVRKNRRVYVESIELETVPLDGPPKFETMPIDAWIEPGGHRSIDLPQIMRHVTATIHAKDDPKLGPGDLEMSLIQAKVADNPDSPYYSAMQNEKLILENLKKGDPSNIMTLANMIKSSLDSKVSQPVYAAATTPPPPVQPTVAMTPPPASSMTVDAPRQTTDIPQSAELYSELQQVEDLLTGSDAEQREGMARLHQVVRRLRSR